MFSKILKRISTNMKRVKAYYALPVIFPDDENWDTNPKRCINDLLLISPSECTVPIYNGSEHFIVYDPKKPKHYYWCSEPQKTQLSPALKDLKEDSFGKYESFDEFLLDLINSVFNEIPGSSPESKLKYFMDENYLEDILSFTNIMLVPKQME